MSNNLSIAYEKTLGFFKIRSIENENDEFAEILEEMETLIPQIYDQLKSNAANELIERLQSHMNSLREYEGVMDQMVKKLDDYNRNMSKIDNDSFDGGGTW